jgi:curli biogenesis system outer membrane secretion channel CsgG
VLLMVGLPHLAMAQGATTAASPARHALQTLCILDFNRLGDDAGEDWLQRGLADMMISTMNRLGPYHAIEREHLKELLREHRLAASGLVDVDAAIRQGRLARAELLLLGSFARHRRTSTYPTSVSPTRPRIGSTAIS